MSQNPSSFGKQIGEYINYQRTKRQWTIAELADKSSLTSAYLSRLEQGKYESPTIEAVNRIAKAFQMPLTALIVKSQADSKQPTLPDLSYYLHEKYFLPTEAIEDFELFMEVIQKKYKEEINRYRSETTRYWGKATEKD